MPNARETAERALLQLENLLDDIDADDAQDVPAVCQSARNQLALVRRFVTPPLAMGYDPDTGEQHDRELTQYGIQADIRVPDTTLGLARVSVFLDLSKLALATQNKDVETGRRIVDLLAQTASQLAYDIGARLTNAVIRVHVTPTDPPTNTTHDVPAEARNIRGPRGITSKS